jgi:hypothetical protein
VPVPSNIRERIVRSHRYGIQDRDDLFAPRIHTLAFSQFLPKFSHRVHPLAEPQDRPTGLTSIRYRRCFVFNLKLQPVQFFEFRKLLFYSHGR